VTKIVLNSLQTEYSTEFNIFKTGSNIGPDRVWKFLDSLRDWIQENYVGYGS